MKNPQRVVSRLVLLLVGVTLLSGCVSDESRWQEAQRANTVIAYESFVREFPQTKHAPDAHARIDQLRDEEARLAYNAACQANTADAYTSFVERFPNTTFAKQATARGAYLRAAQSDADSDLEAFVEKYPTDPQATDARAELVRRAISRATSSGLWHPAERRPLRECAVVVTTTDSGTVHIWGIDDPAGKADLAAKYRWIYLTPGEHTLRASFSARNTSVSPIVAEEVGGWTIHDSSYHTPALLVRCNLDKGKVYQLSHRIVRASTRPAEGLTEEFRRSVGDVEITMPALSTIDRWQVLQTVGGKQYAPPEWEELRKK